MFINQSEPVVLDVPIDILPGSEVNAIRLGSQGVLPVAILSTPEFDATTVDPSTILLAGAPVKRSPTGDYACHEDLVDGDGIADLLCKIDKAALRLGPADTSAELTAVIFDGTPIRGSDRDQLLGNRVRPVPGSDRLGVSGATTGAGMALQQAGLPFLCLLNERNHGVCVTCCEALADCNRDSPLTCDACFHFCSTFVPPPPGATMTPD